MALKNYTIPRLPVVLAEGNEIQVRGLNLDDVSFLAQVHRDDVDRIIATFRSDVPSLDPEAVETAVRERGNAMIAALLQHFPIVAGNVIAVASDEPEQWDVAQKLPVPVQVDALMKIARLTFNDFDGFKKFVGNVLAAVQSAKAPPQQ